MDPAQPFSWPAVSCNALYRTACSRIGAEQTLETDTDSVIGVELTENRDDSEAKEVKLVKTDAT